MISIIKMGIGLFLDTSNNYFIIAIINCNNNSIIAFNKRKTNKNIVKNGNYWLESFLIKNNISFSNIKKLYMSIGPGSFTGVKVSYNIFKTILLFQKLPLYVINSFDLQHQNEQFSIFQHSEKLYILKDYLLNETKKLSHSLLVQQISNLKSHEYSMNYRNFNSKLLEMKLKSNEFTLYDVNVNNNIKLIYLD